MAIDDTETRNDLKAAVAARRELHPEFEDQVLEAFLARVEERIDRRVAEQTAASSTSSKAPRSERVEIEIVAGMFALAIPLLAIAADAAQTLGVVVVICGLVAVNLLYFIDRWVRMA